MVALGPSWELSQCSRYRKLWPHQVFPVLSPELPLSCSLFLFTDVMIRQENRWRCGSGVEALAWQGQDPGLTPVTRRGGKKGRRGGQSWVQSFWDGWEANISSDKNTSHLLSMSFRLSDLYKDWKMKTKYEISRKHQLMLTVYWKTSY